MRKETAVGLTITAPAVATARIAVTMKPQNVAIIKSKDKTRGC